MNRLHFPIRGRRTSAMDEDDLKDPIAALSPSSSSSSFVLRPSMATNSTPTYVPGRTERGSWSQFMSILWKTFLPMNRPLTLPSPPLRAGGEGGRRPGEGGAPESRSGKRANLFPATVHGITARTVEFGGFSPHTRCGERAGVMGLPVSCFFQVGKKSRCDIRNPETLSIEWVRLPDNFQRRLLGLPSIIPPTRGSAGSHCPRGNAGVRSGRELSPC